MLLSLITMISYGSLSEAFSSLVMNDETNKLRTINRETHLKAHNEINPTLPLKLSEHSEITELREDKDDIFNFTVILSEGYIKEYNELSRINQYNPSKDFKVLTETLCSHNLVTFKELKEITIIIKYIDELEKKETKYNYIFAGCNFLK